MQDFAFGQGADKTSSSVSEAIYSVRAAVCCMATSRIVVRRRGDSGSECLKKAVKKLRKDKQRRTLSMRGCHRGSGIGQLSKEGIRIYVGASRCRPVCRNTLQRWETEFCKDDADNTGIEAHMMGQYRLVLGSSRPSRELRCNREGVRRNDNSVAQ